MAHGVNLPSQGGQKTRRRQSRVNALLVFFVMPALPAVPPRVLLPFAFMTLVAAWAPGPGGCSNRLSDPIVVVVVAVVVGVVVIVVHHHYNNTTTIFA